MELDKDKRPKDLTEKRAQPVRIEYRAAGEGDDAKRTITGAIKYNTESAVMRDWYGDEFIEEISAGAFDDSLKTRSVVGLWSHDTSQVLGNTRSGTMRLESREGELGFELDLPNDVDGDKAWEKVKRGDVDGVSFGMRVTKDKWSSEDREGGKMYKRSILNAELYEISPVAFPAYPANEVAVRSLDEFRGLADIKEDERRLQEQQRATELELFKP